jgi:hypothetical protein
MKNILFFLSISILIGSCASSNNVVSKGFLSKRKYTKGLYFNNVKMPSSSDNSIDMKEDVTLVETNTPPVSLINEDLGKVSLTDYSLSSVNSDEHNFVVLPSQNMEPSYLRQEEDCAEIIKRNGDIIEAVIIEVGVNEIKYKKCSNPDGPTYSILRSDVFMIKNKNGDNDVFNDKKSSTDSDELKVEAFSIVSLVTGISGLVFGLLFSVGVGIFLGILGIIFGAISLKKVKANPEKYTKNSYKMAKAGVITGIIITALSIALLILVVL